MDPKDSFPYLRKLNSISYFQIPQIHILGFYVHAFEILTSLGIFLGIRSSLKFSAEKNLNQKNMIDAIITAIICGFAGAHWVHVWFYEKDFLHPFRLLEIWKGISSTGGFLFGALGCWIYLRLKKLPVLTYGDPIVRGVLIALFFGRLGCTIAHDHPGQLTNFFLGIRYPGGMRHNLGMEEAILVGMMLLIIQQKKISVWLSQKDGRYIAVIAICYGTIRFCLDFLRARDLAVVDPRYAGLTPAQYICALLVIVVSLSIARFTKSPRSSR